MRHIKFSTTLTVLLLLSFFIYKGEAKTYALLIGISNYQRADLETLKNAENDVDYFQKTLSRYCDVSDQNIYTMKGDTVTSDNVISRLRWLPDQVGEGDYFIFYYSGHGVKIKNQQISDSGSDGNNGAICFTQTGDAESSMLKADELYSYLSKIRAKYIVVILDCCNAANLSHEGGLGVNYEKVNNIISLCAASENEKAVSHPSLPFGAFTYYLGEAIRGGPSGISGQITVREAFEYAKSQVNANTKAQNPVLIPKNNLADEIIFSVRGFSITNSSPAYAVVEKRDNDTLFLDLGKLHGISESHTVSETLHIVTQILPKNSSDKVGEALLFHVDNLYSKAKILSFHQNDKINENQRLFAVFSSHNGSIDISTIPEGAQIFVKSAPDGVQIEHDKSYGITPFEFINIPRGKWSFILRKQGCNDELLNSKIDDYLSSPHPTKLVQQEVNLVIDSTPKSVPLNLDNHDVGRTKFEGRVTAGEHTVELGDDNSEYDRVHDFFTVAPGNSENKEYKLRKYSIGSRIDYLTQKLFRSPVIANKDIYILIGELKEDTQLVKKLGVSQDVRTTLVQTLGNTKDQCKIHLSENNRTPSHILNGEISNIKTDIEIQLSLSKWNSNDVLNTESVRIPLNVYMPPLGARDYSTLLLSPIIPGSYFLFKNDDYIRGGIPFLGAVAAGAVAYYSHNQEKDFYNQSQIEYIKYENAIDQAPLAEYYANHQKSIDQANKWQRIKNCSLTVYSGLVAFELISSCSYIHLYNNDRKEALEEVTSITPYWRDGGVGVDVAWKF
jgi:hypothetical protein